MSAPEPAGADPVDRLLERLESVQRSGSGWKARCPAHDDHAPSLSISRADTGAALVRCQVGCETARVLDEVGLRMADLFPDGRDRPRDQWRVTNRPVSSRRRPPLAEVDGPAAARPKAPRAQLGPIVARYRYCDESGAVLFEKLRHDPKDFRVRRPGGAWGIGDARRVLYRLPEACAAAHTGGTVYVVEGEKDADRLAGMGLVATCNYDGAAKAGHRTKWRAEYGDALAGAHVVIIRDRDDAGAAHALAALDDLTGKAADVRIVEPATTGEHDDVSDHLDAGHALDALVPVDPDALRPPGDADPAQHPARVRPSAPREGQDTGAHVPERPALDDARTAVIAGWAAGRLRKAETGARDGRATGLSDAVRKRWGNAAPVWCWARYLGGIGVYPAAGLDRADVADRLIAAARVGERGAGLDVEALRAAAEDGWSAGVAEPLLPLASDDPDRPRRRGRPAALLPPADRMSSGRADGADDGAEESAVGALVAFAHTQWTFGCDTDGELFAVPREGLPVVMPAGDRSPLRRQLTARMYAATGRTFKAETYSVALDILRAEAEQAQAATTHIRAAPWSDGVVLDLGGPDGRVVEILPGTWRITSGRPDHPLFRRPPGAGTLPDPVSGRTLAPLAHLLGFPEHSTEFHAVVGWLITVLTSPGEDCPALWWLGAQGAGKTMRARIVVAVLDPAPIGRRGGRGGQLGRSVEDVVVAARSRFVVQFDNLASLSSRQSATLCGLTTGTTQESRRLHTDADASVVSAQCPLSITARELPAGAEDDLLDRSILLALDRLDGTWRPAVQLAQEFAAGHPAILGALLDLAAGVLAKRSAVSSIDLTRMATHGANLAALDMVTDGGYLEAYRALVEQGKRGQVARDPLIGALVDVLELAGGEWEGTASDLLGSLRRPDDRSVPWPANGRALSARLNASPDVLAAVGVRRGKGRTKTSRRMVLTLDGVEPLEMDLSDLESEASVGCYA